MQHIVILDGTLSRLDAGMETNAGLLYKLLVAQDRDDQNVYYHPGINGTGLSKWITVAAGVGINMMICAAYSHIARHYQTGDRIYLFGFSRGAYAVRSLAGMIGRVGLLRPHALSHDRVQQAFGHYKCDDLTPHAVEFKQRYCHIHTKIEMVGVWDTVKSLGLHYPVLCRFAPMATEFHDDRLGTNIVNAFQALALDETRTAYSPILWRPVDGWHGHLEQRWFAGAHADVGGQVETYRKSRPLSNIPLVWMLEKSAACGLDLPAGWADRFPTDATAPMVGSFAGLGKLFLSRRPRHACHSPYDDLHESVLERIENLKSYRPKAEICIPHPTFA